MRGVYYRTEKDGTPLATPELRISATNNRTVYYNNQNAKEAALQNDEIKEGSIVLTGYADGESEVVIKQQPDWDNVVQITGAQLETGYVCPSDGMIVGYSYVSNADGVWEITVNSVTVSSCWRATPSYSFLNVQCQVNKDDLVQSERLMNVCLISFVPFKTVAEPLTLPVNVMNNPSLPDYSRAVALTISQFPYTAPSNGVVMMDVYSSSTASGGAGDRIVYVNDVEVSNLVSAGPVARTTDLYIPLSRGDVMSFSNNNADVNIRSGHFIPFKS